MDELTFVKSSTYEKGDVMTQSEPTVFIVDDDPSVLKGLNRLMKSVKLNVETYSSARDLLDSDNPDQPGCLLISVGSQNRLSVRTIKDFEGKSLMSIRERLQLFSAILFGIFDKLGECFCLLLS